MGSGHGMDWSDDGGMEVQHLPGATEVLQCLADVILALDFAQLGEVLLPSLALVRWEALSLYHHLSLALALWEVQAQEVQLVQEMQELCEP